MFWWKNQPPLRSELRKLRDIRISRLHGAIIISTLMLMVVVVYMLPALALSPGLQTAVSYLILVTVVAINARILRKYF